MKKSRTLLLTMLMATAPFAMANHDGMGEHCTMHGKKTFEEADADKDGTLDREEAKLVCKMDFDKMDTDHDGTVSKEELEACGRHASEKSSKIHEKHTKEFLAADKDNDGTLTKEEATALPKVSKNFDAIDADKDGTVDREEVHTFMHAKKKK